MKENQVITIYDISEKSGVSIATVSRVLNRSQAVSEDTRKKVLRVIEDCGYTPNAFARGLGLNTMKTIGLLCSDISDVFMAKAISFLEKGLRENEYDSLLCCTGPLIKNREQSLELLLSKHVDGVILVGSNYVSMEPEDNAYIIAAARKTPVIVLNAHLDAENIYCCFGDDNTATMNATQKLLMAGRHRIIYLYRSKTYSGIRKLEGYLKAYETLGLPFRPEWVMECRAGDGIGEIKGMLEGAAAKGIVFDAVIAAEDDLSVGAIKYARDARIKIPQELQVIGFNNSALCLCTEPELSSVDNKLQSLCQSCISTLMGVLNGQAMPKCSIFSGELIERGTTLLTG